MWFAYDRGRWGEDVLKGFSFVFGNVSTVIFLNLNRIQLSFYKTVLSPALPPLLVLASPTLTLLLRPSPFYILPNSHEKQRKLCASLLRRARVNACKVRNEDVYHKAE